MIVSKIFEDGYRRFALNPLRIVIRSIRSFTIVVVAIFLPLLVISFFVEKIIWTIFSPILKRIIPIRKLIPFEDLKVSLVIPNWNGIDYLKECLPSIFNADGFNDGKNEVLVIDDGSVDDSVDYVRSNFPWVRLILNRKNKGFGFSCNRGIREAKNELIVLINNDIIVAKDFLCPLMNHFRDEDIFAVTPKLYAWDRKTFVWGVQIGYFVDGYIRTLNEAEIEDRDRISQPSISFFAIGGAMAFRKKDYLWLGGFDNIYNPIYFEDIDISYRAWKRGLKVIYEPNSVVYHNKKSMRTYEKDRQTRNELCFMWKNITGERILMEHLWMLPWHLYKGRLIFLRSFLPAFRHLPNILFHRLIEREIQ